MYLEIHDAEEGNTLAGRVKNIDYDYQAEMWVQELVTDEINRDAPAKFSLKKIPCPI